MDMIANKTSLSNGTILGKRYTITEFIGEGGFGITYRAFYVETHKEVAIKEFFCRNYMSRNTDLGNSVDLISPSDRARLDKDLQKFLQEARILSELSEIPGIVHIIDYFNENGTAYIVMDLVQGMSLEELLKRGKLFTEKELLSRFLPLIKSLSSVHEKGLIHRDIKPQNLIISENGDLTLIDFGTAVPYHDEKSHSVYFSEDYAPPEQYMRKGKIGPYTDIYALCAVMYYCITGIIPENSIQRMVQDELKKPSKLGIQFPDGFENILMKGLEIDSHLRWQNMDDLYKALYSLLPKYSNNNFKIIYLIIGFVIVFSMVSTWYIRSHFKDYRIHKQELRKEAVTFYLKAPQNMTASEFSNVAKIIEKRVSAFSDGNNYLMEINNNNIKITIPLQYFNTKGSSIEDILTIYFSFNGKWLLHKFVTASENSNGIETMELTPDNIVSVSLKYGKLPVPITETEFPFAPLELDLTKKYYYCQIEADDKVKEFLHSTLSKKGCAFTVREHLNYYNMWISSGDGKTIYFPFIDSETEYEAESMCIILSSGTFSDNLELTVDSSEQGATTAN